MKNLLNVLGIILFSITIISCVNNENSDKKQQKQQQIKPINEGNIEKGLMSNASCTMESQAISYTFDRKTKTVTEITIKDIHCREETPVCSEMRRLANKQNIVFKSSRISVENKSKEFDKKVSGDLHFADSKMKATLLFNVRLTEKDSTTLFGTIILSSDNFKKSTSDVTLYVKGKSK